MNASMNKNKFKLTMYTILVFLSIIILSLFTSYLFLLSLPIIFYFYDIKLYKINTKLWNKGICKENNVEWKYDEFNDIASHSNLIFFKSNDILLTMRKKDYKKLTKKCI